MVIPLVILSLAKVMTSINHLILFHMLFNLVCRSCSFVSLSLAIATSLFENASRCKWLAV